MIPKVQSAFLNWTSAVQLRVVKPTAVDFEAFEDPLEIITFQAVIQPMPPQKVDRKPEGLREWKWLEMWTTMQLELDTVAQDPDGVQYRIQSRQDWSQGGFFHYDMTEQPRG